MAARKNIIVLRLPPYHCELNHIELIWAQVKAYIGKNNKSFKIPEVKKLLKEEGSICAAPTENNWYRAQVISTSEENDMSVVKLVDFGGYLTVDNDQLKQIRSDFMTLPFQATEALLAFVKPANDEAEWSGEALRIMAGLTAGQLLHAQVAGYDEAGLPLVHLYLTLNPQRAGGPRVGGVGHPIGLVRSPTADE
ncbi:unnamed protein product [Euphydryas editha]|uniref:Tudor domain-containing protein n=1 Tax=Euphydryas editha TaxID=104508 RepID=A0AAU9TIE3_EUPED|nr:unnamed protein product [Euphydryas editha]